ncbi:DNA repair and recombination protein rad54b [Homalodisca vitripennis]|nr:DNA repair and recombination protein rad54b [Homalodisca vitripennis]
MCRLLTTGSIEEKIYQRQLSKAGLNEVVVDPSHPSAVKLSDEELKDLFSISEEEHCLTHRMLPCTCQGQGDVPQPVDPPSVTRLCQLSTSHTNPHSQIFRINQLFQWEHYRQPLPTHLLQSMGLQDAGLFITFVFRNTLEIKPSDLQPIQKT